MVAGISGLGANCHGSTLDIDALRGFVAVGGTVDGGSGGFSEEFAFGEENFVEHRSLDGS